MSKKPLDLNEIKAASAETKNEALAPDENVADVINEANTESEVSQEVQRENTLSDIDALDAEIAAEEAKIKNDAIDSKTLDSAKNADEAEVVNETIEKDSEELAKKEQDRVEDETKKILEDLMSEENLELTDDEIYKKQEEKRKEDKEREENEKRLKELKESYVKAVINRDKIDLTSYRISTSPIAVSRILQANMGDAKVGAWGLYFSGNAIAMTAFGGSELSIITTETSQNDLIDQVHTFEIIHKHIVDPNKGELKDWLHKFTYLDLSDLFFCIYKATFKGSNYASFTCSNEKCQNVYLAPLRFDQMIVYKNDEVKKRMENIIKKDPTSPSKNLINKKLIQASKDYCCTINVPSLYKIIFEQRVLSKTFRDNNKDLVDTLLYIDEIFKIDQESKMLIPVDTSADPSNHNLSVKRKVAIYSRILMTLNADEYSYLRYEIGQYVDKYNSKTDRVTYQYPETECDKCHTKKEAQEYEPLMMLFLRSRLGRVLNISES